MPWEAIMNPTRRCLLGAASLALIGGLALGTGARAETTLERAKAGDTIKIGYSNEAPYAFEGEGGKMDGFVNVVGLAVLKRMGIKNVEGVLTEWGSLIPGLQAGRFDIITAGMFILPKRCEQVAFTEPMGEFSEQFLVQKGNPKNLHSFEDVAKSDNTVLVTGAGYSTVDWAKKAGIPEDRIMQVADPAAMLQAVRAGRADAASATVFAIKDLAAKGGDAVELAKPFNPPDYTKGYSAFAFRKDDQDFVDAFNAELKKFIGTDEFLSLVEPFGYDKGQLPPESATTAKLCAG
jgi:polar amino acid transport system substrate-binding protein